MNLVDTRNDDVFGKLYKFEHTDTPIMGIGGQDFVDFTTHCQFDMERMDDEICMALSQIDLTKYPTVSGMMPPKMRDANPYVNFENQVLFDYDGDKEIYRNMSHMQRRKHLFFKKRITLPWFFILDLKPNMFHTRQKDLYDWDDVSKLFPYLRECIELMPFDEIGRVVIYGSWPDAPVPCHRDEPPSNSYAEHINFNPGGYRPVYLYDSVLDKKRYLPRNHLFYAYNTTDYHGVDPLPYFAYTVRVDGTYDRTKIKIS